jgi:hypothetical protein
MDKTKIFVMWLDGYLEEKETLNKEQVEKVRNKLNNIFEHVAETVQDDKPPMFPQFPPHNDELGLARC